MAFASPGRGVWGRMRLWNSRLDHEKISSGSHHRKDFVLMSQSHQMRLVMHQKVCRLACYQRLRLCHVVFERGLQRMPRSKSDFAPGLVNVRAVMMLKSAPRPCLVFGSRLVQKIYICTFFKDDGDFTIKTAFVDEIFLALIPKTRILPFGTT